MNASVLAWLVENQILLWKQTSHESASFSACSLVQISWFIGCLFFELFSSYDTSGILWFIDVNLDNFELFKKKIKNWV